MPVADETIWMQVIGGVTIYCIVQAVRDLRAKHYARAAVSATCATALLLTPIRTHAVKLDLPVGRPGR